MKFEGFGVIGNKGMKPTITWDYKNRQGKGRVRVPFIRFSMFCDDLTQKAEMNPTTGRMERPREIVQVILPEGERGLGLFEHLSPGRMVYVRGRQTSKPSIGKNSQGDDQLYANIQVYMDDLQFMDSPIERQLARAIGILTACKAITEEQGKDFVTKGNAYLAAQQEQYGPPRIVIDKTTMQAAAEQPASQPDVDQPDFMNS
jgi:hypothetical protein